jgi:hypothetical protein
MGPAADDAATPSAAHVSAVRVDTWRWNVVCVRAEWAVRTYAARGVALEHANDGLPMRPTPQPHAGRHPAPGTTVAVGMTARAAWVPCASAAFAAVATAAAASADSPPRASSCTSAPSTGAARAARALCTCRGDARFTSASRIAAATIAAD